ncbi:hypothetical protein H9L14_00075 [Sphingomonas sediminicola]|uniref:Peptidase M3A/M3B catalytic domain-containing protein n=1 Tax=Sphingomonas sediminicola TaxID=386874 RepID=A0ABX6T7L1_9SPHN|nr:hypothetical protein H9L14_00075 [Sphingomonas sediminicola]
MLENWVYDYDTLRKFAIDASGKPIPRDLVEKMNQARYFNLGMEEMRQLGLSNVSLQYYVQPAPADLGAAARAYQAKYDILPPAPSLSSKIPSAISQRTARPFTPIGNR